MPILREKLAYISQIIEHSRKFKLAGSELLCVSVKSRPANGTFGFSDTRANAQKTKRAIFCQRTDGLRELKK